MAPPRKAELRGLTSEEQAALEHLAKATSERVDRVRRARALLAVARGHSFPQAARHAGMSSPSTVFSLVQRFNERGLAALAIAAGRGRAPIYDAAARALIVATAQQPPERRPDGTATWSLSTLQRRVRRDGLARVGTSTIRRVLRAAGSS